MSENWIHLTVAAAALALTSVATAGDDPRHERHELMEEVKEAAKPIGQMFEGERDYDSEVVMASLQKFADVAETFGDLFPPGTETGGGTEAAPAIWEDREGFDAALVQWREATDVAIAANPATLEDAQPVVSEVFGACKNCHDTYRIEEEEE